MKYDVSIFTSCRQPQFNCTDSCNVDTQTLLASSYRGSAVTTYSDEHSCLVFCNQLSIPFCLENSLPAIKVFYFPVPNRGNGSIAVKPGLFWESLTNFVIQPDTLDWRPKTMGPVWTLPAHASAGRCIKPILFFLWKQCIFFWIQHNCKRRVTRFVL